MYLLLKENILDNLEANFKPKYLYILCKGPMLANRLMLD